MTLTSDGVNSSSNWNNFTEIPENANMSQYPFPSTIWDVRPVPEVAIKVATLAPVALLGLLGNGSLVRAILRNRALRGTTTNLLILNMAIADFGTSLFCPWMFICVDVFQNYVLGSLGCQFDGFLLQAMTLVAVFSLSAVSYDRVCAIVLDCSGKLSIRSARILILVSWLFALCVAVPLAFIRKHFERQWKNHLETFCMEMESAYSYWHIFVGLSVWTPLGIMAICYTTILIKLDRYETHALKSKHPIVVKYKGQVARVLALVVLAFIICRVPFTALVIRRAQMRREFEEVKGQANSMYVLWYASRYLVFVNAALNPLLYGYTSGPLRQELTSHAPLSWIIPKRRVESKLPRAFERLRSLKPRSPCIRLAGENREPVAAAVPNISSSVQSRTSTAHPVGRSGSRFYKKLRINSIIK